MNIVVGSDHGGFELKEELKKRLEEQGHTVFDVGCHDKTMVDYPKIAVDLGKVLLAEGYDFGLLCCGTGIGISIAANKIRGIRAALCTDCYSARMAKEHNDANVIAFGGRTVGIEHAWAMVQAYMQAEFQHGIHEPRVNMIDEIQ